MKIASIIGTRPQYIKESVIQPLLRSAGIKEIVIDSGQHYDYEMSKSLLAKLKLKSPDYNLKVRASTQTETTAEIMLKLEPILIKIRPDVVLVYGDTNTTLAGALTAVKLKIPIAHIEAGIRMVPKDMPEEINRVITDHVSSILFVPSKSAEENLKKEGIIKNVFFAGDVHYDLFLKEQKKFLFDTYEKLNLSPGKYSVVTLHRDFNVDTKDKLEKILEALAALSEKTQLVFPLHPRTEKRIKEFNLSRLIKSLFITKPLNYLDLMGLISKCDKVITDSGGLQKEAYFAGRHALVLLPDAGWNELIDLGWNKLVTERTLLKEYFSPFSEKRNAGVYGNGKSAEKIVTIISKFNNKIT